MTAMGNRGKGEKVVQETTSRQVTGGLCLLEAVSSCKPPLRVARPNAVRWRVERLSRLVTGGVDKWQTLWCQGIAAQNPAYRGTAFLFLSDIFENHR